MRETRSTATWLVVATLCAGLATAAAADEARVVVVMDPPSAETNRFWTTSGDLHLGPALQTLVGNDPLTGAYDNSGLAASWERDNDFTSWTFHLDPDARFHDGWGPVTAADVVHSYELHTGGDSILSGLGLLAGAEVTAVDDHTVRFELPEPRPNFLFAHGGRGIMVVYSRAQYEAEGLEGYYARPAGSGPFRYVERRLGEGVTFERVEGHWSGDDARIEALELRYVAEPSTKLAMLLAGEAEIVALPRELQGGALEAGFEVVASTGPAMQTAFMLNNLYPEDDEGYNPDLPWLDVRIREAMNRAIDREVMIEVLYDGRAEKLVRFMMDGRHEGFAPGLVERFEDDYGYDPERARALLEEAGYP
jgi:peptide/nickel transport system substrate-binding protein